MVEQAGARHASNTQTPTKSSCVARAFDYVCKSEQTFAIQLWAQIFPEHVWQVRQVSANVC